MSAAAPSIARENRCTQRARSAWPTRRLGSLILATLVGSLSLYPSLASAVCATGTDVICNGPAPNGISTFVNFNSVTFLTGETQIATSGLALIGGNLAPTIAFAMDATSSITATTVTAPNDGSALHLVNDFGAISTTTPSFTGISGTLTSTRASGLSATTTNVAGDITILQNLGSTITGKFNGINANVKGSGGALIITTKGLVSATNGTAILAQSSAIDNDPIIVTNDGGLQASAGEGIIAISQSGASGAVVINSNAAIASGAGGPGTLISGISATANSGSNANITVNLSADIGATADVASQGMSLTSGSSDNTGNLTVNAAQASIFADSGAIAVRQFGKGDVRIMGTGSGTFSAVGAIGVNTLITNNNSGQTTIDVKQNINAATSGIRATTSGAGNIDITARGKITAAAGDGIAATATGATSGTASVTISGGANVTEPRMRSQAKPSARPSTSRIPER